MGTLYVVATPIGNLKDMTFRAVEVLKSVKYIAAEDTRHVMPLLKHFEIQGIGLMSLHKFNETQKCSSIVDKIIAEQCDIAIVSDAGTPCISDPGSVLVAHAIQKGVKVVGIPGACAATLALSVCGLDVRSYAFLGFFPRQTSDRKKLVQLIKHTDVNCFVIYESPLRILDCLNFLLQHFPNANAATANDLTKMYESVVSAPLQQVVANLSENPNVHKGEYAIVLQPNYEQCHQQTQISLEAQLVDIISTQGVTLKQAITQLSDSQKTPKKDIYAASLRLKQLLSQ